MKKTFLLASLAITTALALSGCIPLVVAGGAAATAGTNAAGSNLSVNQQAIDTQLKYKAINTLKNYPTLSRNSNVEILCFNSMILLLGQVPTSMLKYNIAKNIAKIQGVNKVFNQLSVGKPISFSTYSSDSWITTKVKSEMVGKVNPFHFTVVTEKGIVYLLGMTTQAEGNEAAYIAAHVSGVKQVVKAYTYVKHQAPGPNGTNNPKDQVPS